MAHLSCGNRPLARCPNQPCCGGLSRSVFAAFQAHLVLLHQGSECVRDRHLARLVALYPHTLQNFAAGEASLPADQLQQLLASAVAAGGGPIEFERPAQIVVDTGLPSGATLAKEVEDVTVEAQRHELFGAATLWAANAADESATFPDFGLGQIGIGQFRGSVGIFGDLPRDVLIRRRVEADQVAAQRPLALWHSPSSSR